MRLGPAGGARGERCAVCGPRGAGRCRSYAVGTAPARVGWPGWREAPTGIARTPMASSCASVGMAGPAGAGREVPADAVRTPAAGVVRTPPAESPRVGWSVRPPGGPDAGGGRARWVVAPGSAALRPDDQQGDERRAARARRAGQGLEREAAGQPPPARGPVGWRRLFAVVAVGWVGAGDGSSSGRSWPVRLTVARRRGVAARGDGGCAADRRRRRAPVASRGNARRPGACCRGWRRGVADVTGNGRTGRQPYTEPR